ncbi:MAG: FprA family A-type flavoprotein [Eubacteriales bacterium]|nr:FprA family A-type flavoprotein [Eubacteriales bacterium]
MYCYTKIQDDMYWIGGNDRKLSMFEGAIPMTEGMSYNSYFVDDEKTVVLDTADDSVSRVFHDNLEHLLGDRPLDYVIVNHVEPDHSASLCELVRRHPEVKIVATSKIKNMLKNYVSWNIDDNFQQIDEGDELSTGKHVFTFVNTPMVHWPEVMMTYEKTTGTLFSADAFGIFGAHDGNIFADCYDFERDWLPYARRYYTTIVGKFGKFTLGALKKAGTLDIKMICPLHGYIIRKDFEKYLNAYTAWGSYEAEEQGVLVLYASPYGNTQNAAEILASEMAANGVAKMKIMDVSHTDPMYILPEVFRFSNLVIATTTYNGDMFIKMEEALTEMRSMGVSNKKVSIIQSGSWAPTAGKKVQEMMDQLKGIEYVGDVVTVKGTVKEDSRAALETLAKEIAESLN